MTYRDSTRRWSAFGAVLMWTVALSSMSCSGSRKVVKEQMQTEVAERMVTEATSASSTETKHAMTLMETTEGLTVTEIEIYDTTQPADSLTGKPPVRAVVRQRYEQNSRSGMEENAGTVSAASSDTKATYDGVTLDEVVVTAEKPPDIWERVKRIALWTMAIVIGLAAVWVSYRKIKTRKT